MCLYNSSRLSEEKNDSMYYNKYRIYPKIEAFSHADAVKRENAIKNFFTADIKIFLVLSLDGIKNEIYC